MVRDRFRVRIRFCVETSMSTQLTIPAHVIYSNANFIHLKIYVVHRVFWQGASDVLIGEKNTTQNKYLAVSEKYGSTDTEY